MGEYTERQELSVGLYKYYSLRLSIFTGTRTSRLLVAVVNLCVLVAGVCRTLQTVRERSLLWGGDVNNNTSEGEFLEFTSQKNKGPPSLEYIALKCGTHAAQQSTLIDASYK